MEPTQDPKEKLTSALKACSETIEMTASMVLSAEDLNEVVRAACYQRTGEALESVGWLIAAINALDIKEPSRLIN